MKMQKNILQMPITSMRYVAIDFIDLLTFAIVFKFEAAARTTEISP
jgi:hypothetical protein